MPRHSFSSVSLAKKKKLRANRDKNQVELNDSGVNMHANKSNLSCY